jgi:regulatory protein
MTQRTVKLLQRDQLFSLALRSLGGRAYSAGELRAKLQRRAVNQADVESILEELKRAGYLDDRRFAESYAAARLENQGLGRMRVLQDLRARRVAPQLAEKAAEAVYGETDEAELIRSYLERKYRGKALGPFLAEEKNLAAAYRRLRYAGFSAGASIRVLKQFSRQADELEGLESEEPGAEAGS